MIEYEKCSSYQIGKGNNKIKTEEVTIQDVFELLDKNIEFNLPEHINKIKVIGFDDSDNPVTHAVSLNHFIIFQTDLDEDTYIFSLNNWYKIDNNYFAKIQNEIMEIPILQNENFLSGIKIGESEGDYNTRQNSEYFLCLDKHNFQIQNSHSKIEVCDLLSKEMHFVCVKKGTRSATLSHLFAQGSISMQLLRELSPYREFVVRKVNEEFPDFGLSIENFPYDESTLVYAISTDKSDDIRNVLPFFSKVNLLHHINLIRRLGIKVALYKIPILTVENES
jgi:uncharacterized protein (TIGR04141 family)